jgi:hypothetical protein
MDNVANTFAMCVNNPAPAIPRHGTTITHDQPAVWSLPATISQYFIGRLGARHS